MLSEFLVRAQQWRDFATAHSCGLRRFASVFINQPEAFATAHSCGLRLICLFCFIVIQFFATAHSCGLRRCRSLMTSAFATFASAHSCGLRQRKTRHYVESNSLPQRIRAGCDSLRPCRCSLHRSLPQRIRAGCDVDELAAFVSAQFFASAHSCGLRH